MSGESEPVPKLPRGRGFKLSGPEMFRIVFTLVMLIAIILMTRPCANAVSKFVTGFGGGGSAAQQMPTPNNVAPPEPGSGSAGSNVGPDISEYETLKPGMSEAEIKAAIERARARAQRESTGSDRSVGSASATGSGSAR